MWCLFLNKEIKSNAVPKPNLILIRVRKAINYSILLVTRSSRICNIKLLIVILYVAVHKCMYCLFITEKLLHVSLIMCSCVLHDLHKKCRLHP